MAISLLLVYKKIQDTIKDLFFQEKNIMDLGWRVNNELSLMILCIMGLL